MNALEQLIQEVSRLPGIGKKSATRIGYYLLTAPRIRSGALAAALSTLHDSIHPCSICGSFTEQEPCAVCSDPERDSGTICVVEHAQDVVALEASREFRGLYHVLGGVIAPIDGVGPGDLRIGQLERRARDLPAREVVIATNPTVEGDTTAMYVAKQLEPLGVSVTRLALGLPVGGDLEYADRMTLARSLRGRTPLV